MGSSVRRLILLNLIIGAKDRGDTMPGYLLCQSDARTIPLPDRSVHCVVTSPPYFGLRDYGTAAWEGGDDPACDHVAPPAGGWQYKVTRGEDDPYHRGGNIGQMFRSQCRKCGARRIDRQIGLEDSIEAYVDVMVRVFREVRRCLRDDGTLWLNMGDAFSTGASNDWSKAKNARRHEEINNDPHPRQKPIPGMKPKNLLGMPWTIAKALQAPFYAGRIKSELDRVWLAAIIDGEGSISGFTHIRKDDGTTRTGIHITITNTSHAMLDNAFRIWPTSRQDHNPHGKGHRGSLDVFRWIAHNVDSKALLLRELYPYLITKKKQALLAWNFLEMSKISKRSNKTESDAAKVKRAWIVSALSRLNHMQDVDIPSWCKEPPNLLEPGWILRSAITWCKGSPMPESCTDRPTSATEMLFLLAKSPTYYYDQESVRVPHKEPWRSTGQLEQRGTKDVDGKVNHGFGLDGLKPREYNPGGRNLWNYWIINSESYPGSHFATFPRKLVEPCIKAGSSERGCCPRCGAGWTRRVEATKYEPEIVCAGVRFVDDSRGDKTRKLSGHEYNRQVKRSTLGWHASCQCPPHAPVPAVILDPFAGSGTTLVVANALGRRAIGLDLSREYLTNQAQRRLERPHAKPLRPARVEPAMPLFGGIDP